MEAIIFQKEVRNKWVIAYASKKFSHMHKKFHPMEGSCYVSIWGILHFRQYLYMKHFSFQIDHKPLEWLAIILYAYGKKGRWINTLQDSSFKIIHCDGCKHTNVDALSRNPVDVAKEDEDSRNKIQDYR